MTKNIPKIFSLKNMSIWIRLGLHVVSQNIHQAKFLPWTIVVPPFSYFLMGWLGSNPRQLWCAWKLVVSIGYPSGISPPCLWVRKRELHGVEFTPMPPQSGSVTKVSSLAGLVGRGGWSYSYLDSELLNSFGRLWKGRNGISIFCMQCATNLCVWMQEVCASLRYHGNKFI